MTPTQTPIRIRESYWIAAVLFVAAAMYLHTFRYLWDKWMNDEYSLGVLAPIVCGYLMWKKLPQARLLKRSPSVWGLAIIAVGLVFHLAGTILDVSGPSSVSIILLILGGCLYFHGRNLVRLMGFPIAYMVFMIPIPGGIIDRIALPMQLVASSATAGILDVFISNVYRAGIQISVDGYEFVVAPACSGLNSLVALVGVTAVFAYLTRLTLPLKWLLFAFSLPIALAANIVRISTIGMLGHYWDWDKALNIYHDWSSPMLFLVAIALLFAINGGLEWLCARRTTR